MTQAKSFRHSLSPCLGPKAGDFDDFEDIEKGSLFFLTGGGGGGKRDVGNV